MECHHTQKCIVLRYICFRGRKYHLKQHHASMCEYWISIFDKCELQFNHCTHINRSIHDITVIEPHILHCFDSNPRCLAEAFVAFDILSTSSSCFGNSAQMMPFEARPCESQTSLFLTGIWRFSSTIWCVTPPTYADCSKALLVASKATSGNWWASIKRATSKVPSLCQDLSNSPNLNIILCDKASVINPTRAPHNIFQILFNPITLVCSGSPSLVHHFHKTQLREAQGYARESHPELSEYYATPRWTLPSCSADDTFNIYSAWSRL